MEVTVANPMVLTVSYASIDGVHFFTGDGPLTKGLCAAHADLKTAFDAVGQQLPILLKENHGMNNVMCEPVLSYEEFEDWLHSATVPPSDKIRGRIGAGLDWGRCELAAA